MTSNITRFPITTPPAMAAETLEEMQADKPVAFVISWLTPTGEVKTASYASPIIARMMALTLLDEIED